MQGTTERTAMYFKQNFVAKDLPAHMILERVIDEYKSVIVIIGDSQVILLSTIRNRYTMLADRCENVILFWYFLKCLANAWEDISFIPQPGLSDLVCGMTITVGDALKKAYKLENVIEAMETENTGDAIDGSISDNDKSLVHRTYLIALLD